MHDDFDLTGRVALVTGASVGIGRAIALAFVRHGAKVVIHCHTSRAESEEVLAEVRRGGGEGIVIAADLTKADEARRLVDQSVERYGRLDILVNNAGSVVARSRIEDCTLELWNEALAVNLTSAFLVTQRAIPHLRASGNGAIVNNLS
ncbi:MAG TPA: SDR family NAD(P)-dependent oxidoreductase, partial [Pirellulaceae bacterium]|nr:SDR family NAD(P)-dependent oxidoreductase [Pirellulaceae bacterium]